MGTIWLKARWTHIKHEVFRYLLVWWLRPTLTLKPRLTLTLIPLFSTAPMDTVTPVSTPVFTTPLPMAPTTDPMLDTTILARDLLKPSLKPRLTLMLTPLFSTAPLDTVTPVCTLVFTTPMPMVPTTDPMLDTTILVRDLLKPSLKLMLMLRLIPTFFTVMVIPMLMVMLVFITPMPTAPTTTDLTDMPTGDKQLTESSQKNYKRKRSTLFVEQLLHYTSEWICHQLLPL